jgi:phenylpyruvate tautomerase PptA (4-oxalocrotonate tautomerase family)
MPFIHMKVAGPTLAPEQVRRLQQQMTVLSEQALGAASGPAAVLIQPVALGGWSIDAEPVQIVAHVAIEGVPEDRSAGQRKARLIQETSALLERVLGAPLENVSFVVIDWRTTCPWST